MKKLIIIFVFLAISFKSVSSLILPLSFSNDSVLKPIDELITNQLNFESRIDSLKNIENGVEIELNFEGYNIPLHHSEIVSIIDTVGSMHIIRYKIELEEYTNCGFILSFDSFDKNDLLSFYNFDNELIHNSLDYKKLRVNENLLVPVSINNSIIIEYSRNIENSLVDMSIDKIIINPYETDITQKNNFISSYGASANCNIDVNCAQGGAFCKQKNSIVKISLIVGTSTYSCSGSLVNNTLQDYKPYILSAFHCFDTHGGHDYSLSEQEKLYMQFYTTFEFFYWNNNCGSGPIHSTEIYNGAQFRSGWHHYKHGTDFVLVELLNPIKYEESSTDKAYFNGWDRAIDNMYNTSFIHHPKGDVMKITSSNSLPSIYNDYQYIVDPTSGIIEGASSGGPYFNSESLVVGVVSSFLPYVGSCSNQNDVHAGRFSRAWSGNGTVDTRLKDFLDPINSGLLSLNGIYKHELLKFGFNVNSGQTFHYKAYSDYVIGGSQIASYSAHNNGDLTLQAGREVRILPCTNIKNGSEFHAFIEKPDCDDIVYLSDNWSEHNPNVCTGYPKLSEFQELPNDISSINNLTLSPNPVSGILSISINAQEIQGDIMISDLLGNPIATIPLSGINSGQTTYDTSRLTAGTYFVTINTENGAITEKFIKMD